MFTIDICANLIGENELVLYIYIFLRARNTLDNARKMPEFSGESQLHLKRE